MQVARSLRNDGNVSTPTPFNRFVKRFLPRTATDQKNDSLRYNNSVYLLRSNTVRPKWPSSGIATKLLAALDSIRVRSEPGGTW